MMIHLSVSLQYMKPVQPFQTPNQSRHHASCSRPGHAYHTGCAKHLRGGSQSGNMRALDAVFDGVCDCLCADHAPSALLPRINLPDVVISAYLRPWRWSVPMRLGQLILPTAEKLKLACGPTRSWSTAHLKPLYRIGVVRRSPYPARTYPLKRRAWHEQGRDIALSSGNTRRWSGPWRVMHS